MRLLVTTSNYVAIATIDPKGGMLALDKIHEGDGVYTGATWNSDHLFIAGKNGRRWKVENERERVYVLDKDLNSASDLQFWTSDIHQVHWSVQQRALLICDTGHDAILCWSPETGIERHTLPTEGLEVYKQPNDYHHLNTIWTDRNGVWWIIVRYSSPRQSEVWKLRAMDVEHRWVISPESHNLCVHNNALTTVGSFDHSLDTIKLRKRSWRSRIELPVGYPRGLAVTDDYIIVGGSARGSRTLRHQGNAQIMLIGRGKVRRIIQLPSGGQIYTVRALDVIDWAHQGDWGPRAPI